MQLRKIDFSPPDITEKEIDAVVETLKSGWITTGPKTKEFEKKIAEYVSTDKAVCLSSATAAMELVLRLFDVKKGDEVITTPYTFASTVNVILHVGAKPVLVDIKKDSFDIDPDKIEKAITKKTKCVISVDFAGYPVDYDNIKAVLESSRRKFHPRKRTRQVFLEKILFLSDAAHSFGSEYKDKKVGSQADFTTFSFHAVKNLTTAEGGAVSFNKIGNFDSNDIYSNFMLLSLHGQNKDALSKIKSGNWHYDIKLAGFKYNMTDIQAALGLAQLERYKISLQKREEIFSCYNELLKDNDLFILPPFNEKVKKSSFHLYPLRIRGIDEEKRALIIEKLFEKGISCNVHFIPIPMHSCYKTLGYSIKDFPNCYEMYKNEITLPLYPKLTKNDIEYIVDNLKKVMKYLSF